MRGLTKIEVWQQEKLKEKQRVRSLQLFLGKLKDIKIVFQREVSEINKNVAKKPVEASEVLDSLNKRYNLGIKRDDFKMEQALDTIGEHFVTVTYQDDLHNKDFTFYIKVQIREKKTETTPKAAPTQV